MTESFLIYLPDPYGVGRSRYAVATSKDIRLIAPNELLHETGGLTVTYEVSALIDDLRRNDAPLPQNIVDVAEAIRLALGVSKSDGGEQKWNFWKRVRPHFNTTAEWKRAQAVHEGREHHPGDDDILGFMGMIANALIGLWRDANALLTSSGEKERFDQIEVPVAQIFYYRQMKGIRIDNLNTANALADASMRKYDAYREVAEVLKISPTGLTYWNVSPYLQNTDLPVLEENIEGYALRDQMKLASSASAFARSFTTLQDATRDISVLTRLTDTEGRVFPLFHPLGTISARILVSDPYLQELKRSYRDALRAEDNQVITYFDYSQFEPGIMASLSADEALIELYNSGDVYAALSKALFGSADQRDLCKKIFLAFSYGMSAAGISNLIVGKSGAPEDRRHIERSVTSFFTQFPGLSKFKAEAERRLEATSAVSSLNGNSRRRVRKGKLSYKERRWATSHIVQGTASLIFKRALVALCEEFSAEAIILPMHDAVVMQFGEAARDEAIDRVQHIMGRAFTEICPSIRVRVTAGNFK